MRLRAGRGTICPDPCRKGRITSRRPFGGSQGCLPPGIGTIRSSLLPQVARLLSTSVERQNPCRLSSTIVKGTDVLSEGPPEQPPNGLRPSPMLFEGPISSQRPFESAGFTILRTTIRVCAALRLGEQEQASDRGREEQTCSPLGRTTHAVCRRSDIEKGGSRRWDDGWQTMVCVR